MASPAAGRMSSRPRRSAAARGTPAWRRAEAGDDEDGLLQEEEEEEEEQQRQQQQRGRRGGKGEAWAGPGGHATPAACRCAVACWVLGRESDYDGRASLALSKPPASPPCLMAAPVGQGDEEDYEPGADEEDEEGGGGRQQQHQHQHQHQQRGGRQAGNRRAANADGGGDEAGPSAKRARRGAAVVKAEPEGGCWAACLGVQGAGRRCAVQGPACRLPVLSPLGSLLMQLSLASPPTRVAGGEAGPGRQRGAADEGGAPRPTAAELRRLDEKVCGWWGQLDGRAVAWCSSSGRPVGAGTGWLS